MASGKRLATLEMPEDEQQDPLSLRAESAAVGASTRLSRPEGPAFIPLPPIPAARRREIMVQLSIKAPLALVERLDGMTRKTGAQKQAVLTAALDAYLLGHGY